MGRVLVSVVTACHNHGRYLEDCAASVARQTHRWTEHVIVDDGSTDGSAELALELAERYRSAGRPIRVVRQANLRASAARNRGIAEARGEYVCVLDADDVLAPNAVERLVAVARDEAADLVTPYVRCFGVFNGAAPYRGGPLARVKEENGYACCSLFARRLWEKVGGYDTDPTLYVGAEDWTLWIELLKAGASGAVLREYVFRYRTSHVSLSTQRIQHLPTLLAYIVRKHPDLYRPAVVEAARFLHEHRAGFERLHAALAPALGRVSVPAFLGRHRQSPLLRYALVYGSIPKLLPLGTSYILDELAAAPLESVLGDAGIDAAGLASASEWGLVQRASWRLLRDRERLRLSV